MEKELNIAAILKDKPKGLKLWSPAVGKCRLHRVDSYHEWVYIETGGVIDYWFDKKGFLFCKGERLIFPSKQMRDWSKFTWKKGDVLKTDVEEPCYTIFSSFQGEYTEFSSRYYYCGGERWLDFGGINSTNQFVKASDDEAKEFIKKVEEHYGGKLNLSTLQIGQPKQEFKDGDIVRVDEEILIILKRDEVFSTYYHFFFRSNGTTAFDGSFNKSGRKYRLATDSEKQQLFDALAKEGKRWNPETKQIEDLPKKCEFEPMDFFLAKYNNSKNAHWFLYQYAFTNKDGYIHYINEGCIEASKYTILPYNDSTKHLLGTTDEWEGDNNV